MKGLFQTAMRRGIRVEEGESARACTSGIQAVKMKIMDGSVGLEGKEADLGSIER
jgi:hypothetical protein